MAEWGILPIPPDDRSRAEMLDRYLAALDAADMDMVLVVVEAAGQDPILDQMLTEATSEMHRQLVADGQLTELTAAQVSRARETIRILFHSADAEDSPKVPPLRRLPPELNMPDDWM